MSEQLVWHGEARNHSRDVVIHVDLARHANLDKRENVAAVSCAVAWVDRVVNSMYLSLIVLCRRVLPHSCV